MKAVIDQDARDCFVNNIDQPYSVIAAAGAGKTHAIVERVANMIQKGIEGITLVTYTNKAANEMRKRLEEKFFPLPYERVFIGTIHSLCKDLIEKNALLWRIPKIEIVGKVENAWSRYSEEVPNPLEDLPRDIQNRFYRHFERFDPVVLGEIPPRNIKEFEFLPPLRIKIDALLNSTIKGSAKRTLDRLKLWADRYVKNGESNQPICNLPEPPKKTSPVYEIYQDCFGDYEKWKGEEGMRYLQFISFKFSEWRKKRGLLFYDDLIDILLEKATEDFGLSVVLDEAQDTSPQQLSLLMKLAKKEEGKLQLSMVGDPQQSIFSSRASLSHYKAAHKMMVEKLGAKPLIFHLTFRCSAKIVDWVNELGNSLLRQTPTQAEFINLQARPGALQGGVYRWKIEGNADPQDDLEAKDWNFSRSFAQFLSKELRRLNIQSRQYHHIAIIAPRRDWLFKLAKCLSEAGIGAQLHAEGTTATIPERIMRSILHMMTYPFDSFEILGFLRELTFLDDKTLACIAQEMPAALTIMQPPQKDKLPLQVFKVLLELFQGWSNSRSEPIDKAILGFCKSTRIDERVHDLTTVYGKDLYRQWLLEKSRIVALAASGSTLRELLESFENPRRDLFVEPGSLQLMTMHKSKGLEWDVVILPFLHRQKNLHRNTYPMVDIEKMTLCWKMENNNNEEYENFERLLYVAITRAKNQLILVDDSDFYSESEKSAAGSLKLLKKQEHSTNFNSLQSPDKITISIDDEVEVVMPSDDRVIERRKLFPVRTPSAHSHLSSEREGLLITPGGEDYGRFWHDLWKVDYRGDFKGEILERVGNGPFSERAKMELTMAFSSKLIDFLKDPQNKVYVEYPFFVLSNSQVIEGRADMVISFPDQTLVIDWKTDRLPIHEISSLYQSQMSAYKEAFKKLMGMPVKTSLFSTVHGKLIENS